MKLDPKDITRGRAALIHTYGLGDAGMRDDELVRAGAEELRKVLEHGETPDFTEESLLVIMLQRLGEMYPDFGDKALADRVKQYMGQDSRLRCNRYRVGRLRKKYGLDAQATTPAATAGSEGAYGASSSGHGLVDAHYVMRADDQVLQRMAQESGKTILLYGPRGVGKNTMLNRYLETCEERGKLVAVVDFSRFDGAVLQDYGRLLHAIATRLARELEHEAPEQRVWDQAELTYYVEDQILSPREQSVVLVFLRVDKLLGRGFEDDVFSMLRNWHNERSSFRRVNPWRNMDLASTSIVNPARLISDPRRSPFSVSHVFAIGPFDASESQQFAAGHDLALTEDECAMIHELLHGHPELWRLLVDYVAHTGLPATQAVAADVRSPGPFSPHLERLAQWLSGDNKLRDTFRGFVRGGTTSDQAEHLTKLVDHGLLRRTSRGEYVVFCPLYTQYFR